MPVSTTNQTSSPVTDDKILKYREALAGRIKDAQSKISVKESEYNNCLCDEKDARDLYGFFKAGSHKYVDLKECTVSPVAKTISELLIDLEEDYAGDLKKSIDTKLAKVLKGVKDFGAKTKLVHEAFCKVDAEYKDQCNSSTVEILRTSLVDSRCEGRDPLPDPGFDPWISLLCEDVESLVNSNASLENNSVKASSVNALCNLGPLITAVGTLKDSLDKVYTDVCDNIKNKNKKAGESFEDLIEAICCVSEGSAGEREAILELNALNKMCHFVIDCEVDGNRTWDDIEDEINKCLCITKPTTDPIDPDDC